MHVLYMECLLPEDITSRQEDRLSYLGARTSAAPGFIWATRSMHDGRRCGVYVFETVEDARLYRAFLEQQLQIIGLHEVNFKYTDIRNSLQTFVEAGLLFSPATTPRLRQLVARQAA